MASPLSPPLPARSASTPRIMIIIVHQHSIDSKMCGRGDIVLPSYANPLLYVIIKGYLMYQL